MGAACSMGNTVCHFVAYRNGTGRVTFLQSIIPSLSYRNFDYVTDCKDHECAQQFSDIIRKEMFDDDDYNSEDYLSLCNVEIRHNFDRHCVYAACKGQVGDKCQFMWSFTITCTMCHVILPQTDEGLSERDCVLEG